MKDYNDIVRRNVYRLLAEQGKSQAWLAQKLSLSTPQQLNNNLRGRRGLARLINPIAGALGVEIGELFESVGDPDDRELLTLYHQVIALDPARKQYILNFIQFQLKEALAVQGKVSNDTSPSQDS
jgi:transcriptional regulator with XRE-family HTH domain